MTKDVSAIDTISILSFQGEYDGAFAVQVKTSLFEYGEGSFRENIDNIAWIQFGHVIAIYK